MKKILLFLLFSVSCLAQENNFSITNDNIIWENVFITSQTNIPELLSRHSRIKIASASGSLYKGTGTGIRNKCAGTSDYMSREFNFDFEIEISEGKYRVTVFNIKYAEKPKKAAFTKLEKFLLENNAMKQDAKANNDIMCLNTYFNRTFTNTMVFKNKS